MGSKFLRYSAGDLSAPKTTNRTFSFAKMPSTARRRHASAAASRRRPRLSALAMLPLALFMSLLVALLLFAARPAAATSFSFEADVQKVMDILISSLYKTKEVFLRELISNASDAIEKMRAYAQTDASALGVPSLSNLNITINVDPERSLLFVTDNGIGMTKDDLQKNLGTLARSGTAEFIRAHAASKNDPAALASRSSLIGQFGVGFYSAFLVADRIEVYSKHPSSKTMHVWSSNVKDGFTVEPVDSEKHLEVPDLVHGTRIVLHLKEDSAPQFSQQKKLGRLIKKYSEFAPHPIFLNVTKEIEEEVPDEEAEAEAEEADKKSDEDSDDEEKKTEDKDADADAADDEEKEKEKEKKPKTKKVKKTITELRHVNAQPPIWLRSPDKVNSSEYDTFYRKTFRQHSDPLRVIHYHGEGSVTFKLLFFIPRRPQHSVMHMTPEKYGRNVRLYVRRVLITNELVDFLPRYLSFARGVIDSDDFQLNVARETLQNSSMIRRIRSIAISKVIGAIENLSKNTTAYMKFYDNYYEYLKIGIIENRGHETQETNIRKRLISLLRFASTYNATAAEENKEKKEKKSEDNEDEEESEEKPSGNFASLKDYVSRMRKNQTAIYYLMGSNADNLRDSSYAEGLRGRGYEVLLMEDNMDPYVMQTVREYAGFKLQDAAQGDLKFGDEDEKAIAEFEETKKRFEPLTKYLADTLSGSIAQAIISKRLTDSAAALVAPEHGWTGRMHSIMAGQKGDPMSAYYSTVKMNLEINPNHPIMMQMLTKIEAETADDDLAEQARTLYDIALIAGGFPITDVASIVRRMERNVRVVLGVDMAEKAEVKLAPAPAAEEEEKESAKAMIVEAETLETEEEVSLADNDDEQRDGDDLGHFEL